MSVSSCGPIRGGVVRIVAITIKAVVNNKQIVSKGLRVNFCRSCIRWSFIRLSKWNCISPSWRQWWRTLCWSSDMIRIFVVVLPGNYRLIIGIHCLIVYAGMSKCIVSARPVVDRGSHVHVEPKNQTFRRALFDIYILHRMNRILAEWNARILIESFIQSWRPQCG